MKSLLGRIGNIKAVGLGSILALIVAVLFMLDPSPAPAAGTAVGAGEAAKTVAIESIHSDESSCQAEASDAVDTTVDLPSIELATPVALLSEEIALCIPGDAVTAAPESTVPDISVDPVSPQDDPTITEPDEIDADLDASGTPISDAAILLPSEDPTVTGLPVDSENNEPVSDPSLLGTPLSGDDETDATVTDPMLIGFSPAAGSVGPTLSEAENTPSPGSDAGIIVDVISVEGSVEPGGQTSYLFRVANPGQQSVTFRLLATTDVTSWTATVVEIGSALLLSDALVLEPGAEMRVVVIVTAPREAAIGERVSTTLDAVIEH